MKRIGANINQILVRLYSTGRIYADDIDEIKKGVNEIWHTLLSIRSGQIGLVAESFQEEKCRHDRGLRADGQVHQGAYQEICC